MGGRPTDCNPQARMTPPPAPRLLLASASPRRRELLASLGVAFDVVVADVVEHEDPATDPRTMVRHNAALKADWVAARHPAALVLGADTTVSLEGVALNKPADAAAARAMLRQLSGRTHLVFTALAVRCLARGVALAAEAASAVRFHAYDDAVIARYLGLVHTLDKAGGYAIQEHPELLVAGFTGSWTNIVGLPVEETKQLLTQAGLWADSPSKPC